MDTGLYKPLGELLVEVKLLPAELVEAGLRDQELHGGRLGERLVSLGYLAAKDVWRALALQHGLPWISLRMRPPMPQALALLTAQSAHALGALPVEVHQTSTQQEVTVALLDPQRVEVLPFLAQEWGCAVRACLCDPAELLEAMTWHSQGRGSTAAISALGAVGKGIPPPVPLEPLLESTQDALEFPPATQLELSPWDAAVGVTLPGPQGESPRTPPTQDQAFPPPVPADAPAPPPEVTALLRRVRTLEWTVERLNARMNAMLELRLRVAQLESRDEQLRSRLQTAVYSMPSPFGDFQQTKEDLLEPDAGAVSPPVTRVQTFARLLAEAGVRMRRDES